MKLVKLLVNPYVLTKMGCYCYLGADKVSTACQHGSFHLNHILRCIRTTVLLPNTDHRHRHDDGHSDT